MAHFLLGFVHREIKPDNMYFTKSRHIKLGRFELAATVPSKDDLLLDTVGTPDYIAAEIFYQKRI